MHRMMFSSIACFCTLGSSNTAPIGDNQNCLQTWQHAMPSPTLTFQCTSLDFELDTVGEVPALSLTGCVTLGLLL